MIPGALVLVIGIVAAAGLAAAVALHRRMRRSQAAGRPVAATSAAHTEGARPPPLTLGCPSCRREFAPGLKFCPHDARPLVSSSELGGRPVGNGVVCPSCRRSFDHVTRFCPFDAEELMPLAHGTPAGEGAGARHAHFGKICPSCAQKYELEATFCGKDGAELVSVN